MSSSQPQHPIQQQTSLASLFVETLVMLGRYFIIVYPVFLYFILSSLVIPKTAPDFSHWGWWVITVGLAAILYIFKAGWNVMMLKAVENWQSLQGNKASVQTETPQAPFFPIMLLKDFIPGMGEYGLPYLIGGLLWFLMFGIPIGSLIWVGYWFVGLPHGVLTLLQQENVTTAEFQKIIANLSVAEIHRINEWTIILLVSLVLLILINTMTLFWQQYLVLKQCSPFKAFAYSAKQALRHPFKTFFIAIIIGMFNLLSYEISATSTIGAFLGNFLIILLMVFFGLFQFLYLIRQDEEVA